jgi:transcription elongation factor Elf1
LCRIEPYGEDNDSNPVHGKLALYEAILNGQSTLWNDSRQGLTMDWNPETDFESLQRASLKENAPISSLLDSSLYDMGIVLDAFRTLVHELSDVSLFKGISPNAFIESFIGSIPVILDNVLRHKQVQIQQNGLKESVSPEILSIMGGALIQPSMVYIGINSKKEYLDAWELTQCPVCGRMPSIVVKRESETWRFKCSFCRVEYKMDLFSCPQCGAKGSDNKEFALVGVNQAYEVASCHDCDRYYKIINIAKLEQPIPEGLEDLYTNFLDDLAIEKGLKRIDDLTQD